MTEEVTDSAESTQVTMDTQDASLPNNSISEQITRLPLEARNVSSRYTSGGKMALRKNLENVRLTRLLTNDHLETLSCAQRTAF